MKELCELCKERAVTVLTINIPSHSSGIRQLITYRCKEHKFVIDYDESKRIKKHNFKLMIKVETQEKIRTKPWFVRDEDLSREIHRAYGEQRAHDILNKVDKLMLGSTRLNEGIYPHDLKVIFKRLNLNAQFIDENQEPLSINIYSSGINF